VIVVVDCLSSWTRALRSGAPALAEREAAPSPAGL
jgi:hypothetical protein